jgi:hypothetical protein
MSDNKMSLVNLRITAYLLFKTNKSIIKFSKKKINNYNNDK